MKCPMRGRQPGHHTTPAFSRERAPAANSCALALDEKQEPKAPAALVNPCVAGLAESVARFVPWSDERMRGPPDARHHGGATGLLLRMEGSTARSLPPFHGSGTDLCKRVNVKRA